ncbi:MAG TPA: DNA polymerase III subunit delta' [Candidatus Competibacteraceae bacterium]|nr:DNA polymerase III subunit delta' [Candidatus Competibacteraceae bacterium]
MGAPYPWCERQWRQLQEARAAGRLHHALLLHGPAGLGKRAFAERLAASLLCQQPGPESAPCGRCRACHLFGAGSHPDLLQVSPEEADKPIRIDQIRELTAFLGYTSQFGATKIALLWPAERMNLNAANSLLKTLEEPPPASLLLMVAERPAQLPATVRSRCQKLVFQPPPAAQAREWLAGQALHGADAALLLTLAGGAPLRALAYAENRWLARRGVLFQTFQQLAQGQGDPLRAAQAWLEGDVAENLGWLVGWHMDLIRLKMTDHPPGLNHPDLREPLARIAARWPRAVLLRRLEQAQRLRHLLGTTQLNPQLALEAFLAEWAGV